MAHLDRSTRPLTFHKIQYDVQDIIENRSEQERPVDIYRKNRYQVFSSRRTCDCVDPSFAETRVSAGVSASVVDTCLHRTYSIVYERMSTCRERGRLRRPHEATTVTPVR